MLTAGVHRTAVVRTRERTGSAPWLCRFETDLSCVRVRLLEVKDAPSPDEPAEIERQYRLELSLAGELPTSPRQGRLLAFPAEVQSPEDLGPVLVNPIDPIELNPSSIYVTPGSAETPRTVYVRVMQPNFDLDCSVLQPLPDGIEVRPGKQDHGVQEFFLYLTDAAPKRMREIPRAGKSSS